METKGNYIHAEYNGYCLMRYKTSDFRSRSVGFKIIYQDHHSTRLVLVILEKKIFLMSGAVAMKMKISGRDNLCLATYSLPSDDVTNRSLLSYNNIYICINSRDGLSHRILAPQKSLQKFWEAEEVGKFRNWEEPDIFDEVCVIEGPARVPVCSLELGAPSDHLVLILLGKSALALERHRHGTNLDVTRLLLVDVPHGCARTDSFILRYITTDEDAVAGRAHVSRDLFDALTPRSPGRLERAAILLGLPDGRLYSVPLNADVPYSTTLDGETVGRNLVCCLDQALVDVHVARPDGGEPALCVVGSKGLLFIIRCDGKREAVTQPAVLGASVKCSSIFNNQLVYGTVSDGVWVAEIPRCSSSKLVKKKCAAMQIDCVSILHQDTVLVFTRKGYLCTLNLTLKTERKDSGEILQESRSLASLTTQLQEETVTLNKTLNRLNYLMYLYKKRQGVCVSHHVNTMLPDGSCDLTVTIKPGPHLALTGHQIAVTLGSCASISLPIPWNELCRTFTILPQDRLPLAVDCFLDTGTCGMLRLMPPIVIGRLQCMSSIRPAVVNVDDFLNAIAAKRLPRLRRPHLGDVPLAVSPKVRIALDVVPLKHIIYPDGTNAAEKLLEHILPNHHHLHLSDKTASFFSREGDKIMLSVSLSSHLLIDIQSDGSALALWSIINDILVQLIDVISASEHIDTSSMHWTFWEQKSKVFKADALCSENICSALKLFFSNVLGNVLLD